MFGVRRNEREGEAWEREAPSCGCAAVCLSCCGVAALSRGFASREHEEGEATYSEGVKTGEGAKVRN